MLLLIKENNQLTLIKICYVIWQQIGYSNPLVLYKVDKAIMLSKALVFYLYIVMPLIVQHLLFTSI